MSPCSLGERWRIKEEVGGKSRKSSSRSTRSSLGRGKAKETLAVPSSEFGDWADTTAEQGGKKKEERDLSDWGTFLRPQFGRKPVFTAANPRVPGPGRSVPSSHPHKVYLTMFAGTRDPRSMANALIDIVLLCIPLSSRADCPVFPAHVNPAH